MKGRDITAIDRRVLGEFRAFTAENGRLPRADDLPGSPVENAISLKRLTSKGLLPRSYRNLPDLYQKLGVRSLQEGWWQDETGCCRVCRKKPHEHGCTINLLLGLDKRPDPW